MNEKQYNFIYSKLITGKDDVVGMLAYSIYKQHKIEFIEDFKVKKGKAPEDSDLEYFIISSIAPSQLAKYRESACAILSENVAAAVQDELSRIDIDFQKSIDSVVKRHADSVETAVEKHSSSNWKTICLNMASSFLFSVILVIVFILGYTTESNLRNKTKAVLETIHESQTEQGDSIPTR